MRQRMPRSEPLMVGWDGKRDGEGEGRIEERKLEDFPDQTSSGQSICDNGVVQIPGCYSQTKEHQPWNAFNCRWPQPPDCNCHLNNINPKTSSNLKRDQLQTVLTPKRHHPQLASTAKRHQCQIAINCKKASNPRCHWPPLTSTSNRHQSQNCRWSEPQSDINHKMLSAADGLNPKKASASIGINPKMLSTVNSHNSKKT